MDKPFDWFYLDGFSWTHLLEFLEIPHYTNDSADDTPVRSRNTDSHTARLR